jgi:hypothetical protein
MNESTAPICPHCKAYLPPSALRCPTCGNDAMPIGGQTDIDDTSPEAITPDIPPPDPTALPPNIRSLNIVLGLSLAIISFVLLFLIFSPNRADYFSTWATSASEALHSQNRQYWQSTPRWPPDEPVNIIYSSSPLDQSTQFAEMVVERIGVNPIEIITLPQDQLAQRNEQQKASIQQYEIQIVRTDLLGLYMSLQIAYRGPASGTTDLFIWQAQAGLIDLYGYPLLLIAVFSILMFIVRWSIVERHRNELKHAYDVYQRRRTEQQFAAQQRLEEARSYATVGNIAKALSAVNGVLVANPQHREARALKEALLRTQEAGAAALIVPKGLGRGKVDTSSDLLYLRVVGTPYAYQAPERLEAISIGRQRRRAGSNAGNDVVVRVPGSDEMSLRISRQHLEIRRIEAEHYVIDRSGGQTSLDGSRLVPNQPTRILNGNRLSIADVLTLEVLVRSRIAGRRVDNVLEIGSRGREGTNIVIEASIGDMVTEMIDE